MNTYNGSDSEYKAILKIFGGLLDGKLNANFIRMKIVGLDAQPVYVDRNGGVGGAFSGILKKSDFNSLRNLVGNCDYERKLLK